MATQTAATAKAKIISKVDAAVNTGPAAAAMISGAIGTLVIGLMTTGAEISEGLKNALNIYNPAGPLSGKTSVGVFAWLIAWFLLNYLWKNMDYDIRKAFIITLVIITVGLLFTFPPFFEAFAK